MRAVLLATLAAATALLAACGSATRTVSSTTPLQAAEATSTQQPAPATSSAPTQTSATTAPGSTSGGTPAQTTRSAPEPAFTEHEASSEGSGAAAAAAAIVRGHGYTPVDTSEYHPAQTLRVLVGTRTGSGDGYDQQAFFFVDGRYIGTDAKEPSASVKVVSQSDTEVVLSYPLYRSSDPLCCPGGGSATVRFQLDNGQLTPLDPIPPATSKSGLARN